MKISRGTKIYKQILNTLQNFQTNKSLYLVQPILVLNKQNEHIKYKNMNKKGKNIKHTARMKYRKCIKVCKKTFCFIFVYKFLN